ncbi:MULTISPECIES: putative monovalent cation/H+ antiporter subunit A [Sphingobacterium]|uniref:Na(+)/H(+) antiporter subunit A n=1 Tax=Sphingobacterium cellulitidis TaxID=1768011 RepID=A0A8H9KSW9_9SPHI|nr:MULTISPECIES: putative monovalent cation/H+ antiporter subunit A [Sphingobacterium]MBA8985599.1 multicomponent Na+:H+ antiporter subunit A [Sphingobacterium soli]WFB64017.1 putative monovalent cation/H+ antiporter subunit A [Sphingobacterium sp. WM]GGE08295.1 Na(+)/H(+) antiporter subunit A [Sphingobacterium soli]
MLFTILLGLISSILLIPFGKRLKSSWSILIPLIPTGLFLYYLGYVPKIADGSTFFQAISWVPSLGVDFNLRLDGLSLLFCLLITGIGTGIFFYARTYLKGHPFFDRFFGYLYLFMSAMLGLVLSDNIFLLFIFWELTSISSFFLIGFNNDQEASRKSAMTALTITGMGGFFLLAGLVLIGNVAGTYQISELIQYRDVILNHPQYPLILFLIFIGAFTKSAQFPFHFWLPGAMKAPTPVSAYLHSATMVKAGIYLLARFFPILSGTELWTYSLTGIGGFTMLYAAIHSLFRVDLKAILAYTTISALGMLVFLLGVGTKEAVIAASVFILVHALYKATLFLVTGIIDHETGTRDITKLAGLKKVLGPVAIAAVLAALSSAGLPSTFGFIGKDLIYEATLHAEKNWVLILTIIAVATNVCLVAAGFMAGIKPFFGQLPSEYEKLHLPYKSMWIPPLILGCLGLLFGLLPGLVGDLLSKQTANSIFGADTEMHLAIWHGFNTVLILSLATLAAGTILYFANKPSLLRLNKIEKLQGISPQRILTGYSNDIVRFADWFSNFFHNGYLRSYHMKIILFAEALLIYKLWQSGPIQIDFDNLTPLTIYEVAVVIILLGALIIVVATPSRLTSVVAMSVIGYCICLMYVFYSAPDLAMTQFTIDTLSTVLFVLVLYKLPSFLNLASKRERYRDSIVALGFGAILSIIALKVLYEPISTETSDFYGENAYILAKGKNVVNLILADFRGIDTMFETVVLGIAALGVYSLLKLRLKSSEKE